MTFDLAQTVSDQPPAFLTNAECEEWLGSMPLANAAHAQGLFLRELNLLYRYAMPEATRFAILETLLQPLVDAQEEMAKKFAARPLPFSPPEQAALDSSLTLWQTLALCYLRCLDACLAGDPALKNEAATVAQRTLVAFADWQVCLCQGEQLPDKAYWRKLNEIFLAVERAGLVGVAVHDKVRHGKMETRPLAAFAECHMLHCANLYELPARYVIWTARWTRRWSSKVGLLDAPPEDIRNRAVPLWVDLDSDQAATYQPRPSKTGRWLETTGVRMSLTARIPLLEQGKAPADLQLGSDVTQPPASKLLNRLLTRWCKGGEPRRHERHAASGQCSFVPGLERVHFQLSGG